MNWGLVIATPVRLNLSPPFGDLKAKVGKSEGITPRWLVCVLEVFFDL